MTTDRKNEIQRLAYRRARAVLLKNFFAQSEKKQFGDGKTCYGVWFSWTFPNEIMAARGARLVAKLKSIKDSKLLQPDTYTVAFTGHTNEDNIFIQDGHKTVFKITIPLTHGEHSVWQGEGRSRAIIVKGSWNQVVVWFLGDETIERVLQAIKEDCIKNRR
jgi:hypothetical protein